MSYELIPTTCPAATSPLVGAVSFGEVATNSARPGPLPAIIPLDQVYYWSYAWRDAERAAMDDLRANRARTFDDPAAAVRYLLGVER